MIIKILLITNSEDLTFKNSIQREVHSKSVIPVHVKLRMEMYSFI